MGKITVAEYVSLDGVMEHPAWTMPYWNDEIAEFKGVEMESHQALLLGRKTYEGFAQAWPESEEEGAEHMNSIPKYVASRTLKDLTWNAQLLEGDVVEAVKKLKKAPENLLVYGSGDFLQTLIEADLVDEYRLLVYPIVLGEGKRLFDKVPATIKLVETQAFSSGVVALIYAPDKAVDSKQ